MQPSSEVAHRIARVIVERLELEDFTAETFPRQAILFSSVHGGLGFDSIGSLEIAAGLADEFGLELADIAEPDFTSVDTLTAYIARHLASA